ncbi:MAG TPA: invasin domain 3-containing protein [Candidatus Dormibacteraeota bacterium]|nr:invasin domain 3-containing protein [Candidatus Dormibacteraeota bacterium]
MRPTERARKTQTGAALSTGVLGAALFVGGAPVAMAATTSPITSGPFSLLPRTQAPTGVNQAAIACFGTGKQITETLSPASITADGTSTSTATATVSEPGTGPPPILCKGQQVAFSSSDSKETVSATTDHGDGTYTAIITSSKTVGQATITAQLTVVNPTPPPVTTFMDATATLTQTAGPAAKITLVVSPSSIPANGTSTSNGTVTVTDANNNAVVGNTVTFSSSDPAEKFSAVTGHPDGTYTVTITSSTTPETATITATDTSVRPNLTATAPLTQTAIAVPVPATGSSVGQPATVGVGMMALGIGLLARARRLRSRRRLGPSIEE